MDPLAAEDVGNGNVGDRRALLAATAGPPPCPGIKLPTPGMLRTPGRVLTMPGGSLAVPRVDVERRRGERPARRGDRCRAPSGSSAITKLIVVSVVEAARLVRVAMLAVARLPCTTRPLSVSTPPAMSTWPRDRAVVIDEAVEHQRDRVQQSCRRRCRPSGRRCPARCPACCRSRRRPRRPRAEPSTCSALSAPTIDVAAELRAARHRAPDLVGGRAACRAARCRWRSACRRSSP